MIYDFLLKNWFDLLQTCFIVGGFILTYRATRHDIRSSRVDHLLQINESHREIWSKTYTQPELLRIRKSEVDLEKHPITEAERRMVIEVIMHIYAVYEAIQNDQLDKGEMEKDISDYLRLPIPNTIWQEVKGYYPKRFLKFINDLLE
jgi:hypothetical protein